MNTTVCLFEAIKHLTTCGEKRHEIVREMIVNHLQCLVEAVDVHYHTLHKENRVLSLNTSVHKDKNRRVSNGVGEKENKERRRRSIR